MACRWRQSSSRPKFPKLQREKLALKGWLAAFLHKNEDGWSLQFFFVYFHPYLANWSNLTTIVSAHLKPQTKRKRVMLGEFGIGRCISLPHWFLHIHRFVEIGRMASFWRSKMSGQKNWQMGSTDFFSSTKTIASSTSVKHFAGSCVPFILAGIKIQTWQQTLAGWCSHFSRAGYLWHPFRAQGWMLSRFRWGGWRLILKHPGWTVFKKELLNNVRCVWISCYDWQACSLNICLSCVYIFIFTFIYNTVAQQKSTHDSGRGPSPFQLR